MPITSAKVVKVDSKIYIGKEITLTQDDITVKTSALADALVYGTDYEIVEGSYINNINKGTASVTIRGIGNYGGMRKISFKVKAKKLLWWWK